ncbi:hypothetical protein ACWEOW_15840 [Monashia sp. NPDC004114]
MTEMFGFQSPEPAAEDHVSVVGCPYCAEGIPLRVTARKIATDSSGRPVVSVEAAMAVHRCPEPARSTSRRAEGRSPALSEGA